jgi:hypothetical protein
MFYVLEPQRDIMAVDKDDRVPGLTYTDETHFAPCDDADATIYAVFRRETYQDEPEYIGDVSVAAARQMLSRAK